MKLLFFILLLFTTNVAFSQWEKKIIFQEKNADSTEEKFDSILIVSIGNSVTRAFLEDLGIRVVERFRDKKY